MRCGGLSRIVRFLCNVSFYLICLVFLNYVAMEPALETNATTESAPLGVARTANASTLTFSPLMRASDALVKDAHRLVCASNLYLHKVRLVVFTLWTRRRRLIDVLPRLIPAEDVIHHLFRVVHPLFYSVDDLVGVRARRATQLDEPRAASERARIHVARAALAFEHEQVPARRAKGEHVAIIVFFVLVSLVPSTRRVCFVR